MTGRAPRVARVRSLAVALPLILVVGGCAAANAAWRAGPGGIPAERTLRMHLSGGHADRAWTAMSDKKVAPTDALLRYMYRGVIGLHAGEFVDGSKAMDRAWTLVEDRFTKRISTGAASLLTSDATLPYYPGTTEYLFIPYYGALNWHARNERDATLVEARRLASLLAREDLPRPPADVQGVLRYVTGALFEAGGARQDALVAYRNAAARLGTLPGDTTLPPPGYGDVVVILEDGFVGRPEPRSMGVYMNGDELIALTTGSDASRLAMARTVQTRSFDPRFNRQQVGWLTYEVHWAAFGTPLRQTATIGARTVPLEFATASANISAAVQADFEREQPARLARAVARTAIRYAALRAAEQQFDKAAEERKKKKEDGEKGGGWGNILLGLGLASATVTSMAIDQPDLRAWQLLPDRITVARLRLPVGEHPIDVTLGGRAVSLGMVTVRDGGVTLLTHRWWPVAGSPARG